MLTENVELWKSGIDYELQFWERWFLTRGREWPEDYTNRLNPNAPIEPWVAAELEKMRLNEAEILDVGAGPITNIGYTHPRIKIHVTACDPLAFQYGEIRRRFSIIPPVETIFATAESLTKYFSVDHFDLVHCRNALDHSLNPVKGILEMAKVVKPGGRIMLRNMRNEAENENYEGFHQFNFDVVDGHFIIWNRHERVDVETVLPPGFTMTAVLNQSVTAVLIDRPH